MTNRWYRAYEGTITDAKLAEAALVVGCSRSVVIAAWHAILENAAGLNDGGKIDIPSRRVAAILLEPFDTIEKLFVAFETIGLISERCIVAWQRRQYESDTSTERSRKHRERSRNADATLQQQQSDVAQRPHSTETETERKKENKSRASALVLPEWLPSEEWSAFVAMRVRVRSPLTDRAIVLTLKELEKLRTLGESVAAVLDQSTMNGWKSVYPLKPQGNSNGKRETAHDRFLAGARSFIEDCDAASAGEASAEQDVGDDFKPVGHPLLPARFHGGAG